MPQGLQVWDASGNLIIDNSTALGKVLGSATITAGASGNVTDAKFALGTPFWAAITLGANAYAAYPVITYNAGLTRLEWTNAAAYNHLLVYGVM